MGTLLHYLITGTGCDLIIICRGEFFLVHKSVIAAHSPVLERDACKSTFLDGEAYILDAVSPDVFRKVLTFMYRDDIPESFQSTLAASTQFPLGEKFPSTDAFLVTIRGKPVTVNLLGGSTKTMDTITNADKWAILMAKQALIKDTYDVCPSTRNWTPKGHLRAKIITWFEKELRTGCPLSEDFHVWAGYILRAYDDFIQPFFRICALHIPVVEKDTSLVTLLRQCNSSLWEGMLSVRAQWQKDLVNKREELQKTRDQCLVLKVDAEKQKAASRDQEKLHKSKMEELQKSLALADGRTRAAQAMAQRLDKLTCSLQQDLLKEKASGVQLKETNTKKENQPAKSDPVTSKLRKQIGDLNKMVKNKEQALKESKATNNKVKAALRSEKEALRIEYAKVKDAFTGFKRWINDTPKCPSCQREHNIRIEHQRYTSIGVACAHCPFRTMWYGADTDDGKA
ncbi:hypothetical protein Z517_04105 [Fonsecaea pedrosoi CBS 271.37]|uniref:BTB domain-containing protein n=1 Tax=Fonsecaea pedrosoi CBS 271.37 TaxID=1442368 RepID=A0A0D2F376_9EURO|nr:uncharacterized protein Z517_04105 [Fonsecaea pedrosoi CBS 271.37]KIW81082.1 hypothetical protein Z517_04105 [Fonsecaea pedrosoi CBS 271.37]